MSKRVRIAVLGGGISGMATAYHMATMAARRGTPLELTLVERSGRLGGVIRTENYGGCVLEWGPENFVSFKPQLAGLIRDLGHGPEMIGSNDARRQTMVVDHGRLQPLPDGMAFLAPVNFRSLWGSNLISARGKLRAMLEPFIPPARADMDVHSFLARRIGAEMTEKVAEPLVSAIYGGDTRRLSIESALPETVRMEREHGSLWRGARAAHRRRPAVSGSAAKPSLFLSMKRGMSQLVEVLETGLDSVSIVRNAGASRLTRRGQVYRLEGPGVALELDAVVLATPAHATAHLVRALDGGVAEAFGGIRYSSTTLVYLAYSAAEFGHPLNGFGFVVPDREADEFDACTWVSSKFDHRSPDHLALFRFAIHDGRRARPARPEAETVERVRERFERLMGVSASPEFARTFHIPSAMPQFDLDHRRRLQHIDAWIKKQPGLECCGAFWGGVGLPDCVAMAERTAERLLDRLQNG